MKIALMDNQNIVTVIYENCSQIEIGTNGTDATFYKDGSVFNFQGAKNFIVVDDSVPVVEGEAASAEILAADKKGQFKKMDTEKVINAIKEQQAEQDLSLIYLFQTMGGGQ